jgi:hypothetical protein
LSLNFSAEDEDYLALYCGDGGVDCLANYNYLDAEASKREFAHLSKKINHLVSIQLVIFILISMNGARDQCDNRAPPEK